MKDGIRSLFGGVSALMEHTTLSVSLAGWPAAVSVLGLCLSAVAIFAIAADTHQEQE